jgi:hypothetical protein
MADQVEQQMASLQLQLQNLQVQLQSRQTATNELSLVSFQNEKETIKQSSYKSFSTQ